MSLFFCNLFVFLSLFAIGILGTFILGILGWFWGAVIFGSISKLSYRYI